MELNTKARLPRKQVFGYLIGMIPLTLFAGFYGLAYAKFFLHDLQLKLVYWYAALVIYGSNPLPKSPADEISSAGNFKTYR